MKDEEVNKCEFCGEIKSVSRYYIRIKNKHFDDNKKGKYSTYISYCNDCGIEPMLSSKHHSYLTDIENIVDEYVISHKGNAQCKCISGARGHLIAKLTALFTAERQQSMEVGRKKENERIMGILKVMVETCGVIDLGENVDIKKIYKSID